MALHTLFPSTVALEPISHKYYDAFNREYLSVTRFLKLLSEDFKDTLAYARASEETRAAWKKKGEDAANHGTRIHNALELYSLTGQVLEENSHMTEAIKSILSEYKGYYQSHDEICLHNDDFRLAGTADKVCLVGNRADSEFDLADFKTNISKGIEYHSEYKKRMFYPIDHLQDCNFVKYSLQLSIYAYFFELLTGRKLRKMWIHFIPPDDMMKHYKIPVMYMKSDVITLLNYHKASVYQSVEPMKMYEF